MPVIDADGSRLGRATAWADWLRPGDAETLARYAHPEMSDFSAATTASRGAGRVSIVGFVPDAAAAHALIADLADREGIDRWQSDAPTVTHTSSTGATERLHAYFNWSSESVSCPWPAHQFDEHGRRGDRLVFRAWDTVLLWEALTP